ncbi:MAG: peptidase M48 Ste24p [uncultured bacterium]|nr:MAG: peptidase M48 Ste24p [uncultured bacterium]
MNLKRITYVFIAFITFSLCAGDMVFAVQKAKVTKNEVKQEISDPETRLYKQAEEDLDRRFYQAYRIVERIARANKLDNYPWRVIIPKTKAYDINAYTSDANAIILEQGFIDSFYGEISVLAYVIAHEMAHQVHKDVARDSRNEEQLARKLAEIGIIIDPNVVLSNRNLISTDLILQYYLYKKQQEKMEETRIKVKELVYEYLAETRKYEYEADKDGLIYIIKAGFNSKGATRFLEIADRYPQSSDVELSTHPRHENRIWQIENLLKTIDIQKYKAEGNRNIKNSKPLTYQKFYDTEIKTKNRTIRAIVINSEYGSIDNINKPFEDLFGK